MAKIHSMERKVCFRTAVTDQTLASESAKSMEEFSRGSNQLFNTTEASGGRSSSSYCPPDQKCLHLKPRKHTELSRIEHIFDKGHESFLS